MKEFVSRLYKIESAIMFLILAINVILLAKYRLTFGTITVFLASMGFVCLVILKTLRKNKYINRLFVLLLVLYLVFMTSFIVIEYKVITGVNYEIPENEYDYVIVLGSGLKNGNELSYVLLRRLNTALEIVEGSPEVTVIVSGGKGPDEDISEAKAMRNYLISEGISFDQVLLEDKSTSTAENLSYTHDLMKSKSLSHGRIALVTNDYHSFRAKYLAIKNGLEVDSISSKTAIMVRINYMIREYYACIKSFIID